MKKSILAVAALTTAFAVQSAGAKTLEDVLKEKGVITEEDYKEVTKSRPLDYKLGEGFTFLSPDEKFKMSLGSCMQFRYTFFDADTVNNTLGTGKAQDYSKFEMKRIKLYFTGYAYTKDLTYKLQMNFANITGGTTSNGGLLEETWMNYRIIDEAQLRFGQDKLQYGRQFITSTAANQFVDASAASNAFVPGYDTGLQLLGKAKNSLVTYSAGISGGLGQNSFRSTSANNAFNGRIAVNPLGEMKYVEADIDYSEKPLVSFGADIFLDTVRAGTTAGTLSESNQLTFAKSGTGYFNIGAPLMPATFTANENIDFITYSFDGAFKYRGFSLQGEYFAAQADGQTSNRTLRGQGYYAQAGYFIIPKQVEVAARYSYVDPNRDVSNDHWVEAQGAVSWYINKHNLKIQADYTAIHKQGRIASTNPGLTAHATDDSQVRLQAQIVF